MSLKFNQYMIGVCSVCNSFNHSIDLGLLQSTEANNATTIKQNLITIFNGVEYHLNGVYLEIVLTRKRL